MFYCKRLCSPKQTNNHRSVSPSEGLELPHAWNLMQLPGRKPTKAKAVVASKAQRKVSFNSKNGQATTISQVPRDIRGESQEWTTSWKIAKKNIRNNMKQWMLGNTPPFAQTKISLPTKVSCDRYSKQKINLSRDYHWIHDSKYQVHYSSSRQVTNIFWLLSATFSHLIHSSVRDL